jgi:hypothetical protein
MEKREKLKKLTLIILFALASAYFLYSGFSQLFQEQEKKVLKAAEGKDAAEDAGAETEE